MHISRVSLVNYRNFARTNFLLSPGVNTIIGENGSGKSNLFRAIRLLLDDAFVTRRHDLKDTDFHRGLDDWRGHWIVIMIEFENLSDDEAVQSLLLQHAAEEADGSTDRATYALVFRPDANRRNEFAALEAGDHAGLAALRETITLDDYERVLLGKMSADLTDEEQYTKVVGDFGAVRFPSDEHGVAPTFATEIGIGIQREMSLWREFSLTFIPALRNVVADFSDSRKNPLRTLLAVKSEEMPEGGFEEILEKVRDLNEDIENRKDVQDVTEGIRKTFKETVGETYSPTSMKIQSELPLQAADLFQSLKLHVGENGDTAPRRLHEMSLGGANLVYLTLKLLEFEYNSKRQAIANFLLIEEPEAHIHTHIQKTLFDRVAFENTQIIYSTHSTHISEVSEIERVNVLSREGTAWVALQPATGLEAAETQSAQRFLDAVRSNLLFSRSALLVEGDAEELLVPNLVKKVYGISLDEIGVSLINVRSTGFKNLGNLFHEARLRKRCAIVTDYDGSFFDTTPKDDDSEDLTQHKKSAVSSAKAGEERKQGLDAYSEGNPYLRVEYAPHTFEVDFAATSRMNRRILASTVGDIYERESYRKESEEKFASDEIHVFGYEALRLAKKVGKGWFALLVGQHLDSSDKDAGPEIPQYILNALGFAASELPRETWARIIGYRIDRWEASSFAAEGKVAKARGLLQRFSGEKVDLGDLLSREEIDVGDLLSREEIDLGDLLTAIEVVSYSDSRLKALAQAFGV